MATRALLGSIQTDAAGNQVLTSTYNHYDGYPENLGVGLNNFYDQTDAAIKISNQGYISYLDPETGEIDAKHKEPADKTVLPDSYEEAMREIYSVADSYGADYIYLYDFDDMEWLNSSMQGSALVIKSFENTGIENQFEGYEGGDLADEDSIRNMEEGYESKWQKFLNEETFDQAFDRIDKEKEVYPGKYPVEKIMSQAMFRLQDEPKEMLDAYKKSLANDIRLNGKEQYEDYSVEDFIEDYENYIGDKMDM
jgi:hypothetical protein